MSNSKDVASLEAELDSLPEDDGSRVTLLIELLTLDGHERHEDIVLDLGIFGNSAAIPAIAKAAEEPPSYIVEGGNGETSMSFNESARMRSHASEHWNLAKSLSTCQSMQIHTCARTARKA
ncbi:hypothetical protein QTH89_14530 [Variovorax sp. J22G21]|uniref:hypothetical protein n=1 Tax=Variovorax fucosicus TaxID=3053517 RepID=UPI002577DFBE|nr:MULTISPECIES: hypothetical protein [unclassified Variovorax]MDM0037638.1 hypothetical protein [Variovorax sp. J22R193]MDM0062414.1 hypothetical protein [Variovorax sp. J22G21]